MSAGKMVRITCADVEVGMRIARTKSAEPREVVRINDGVESRRLFFTYTQEGRDPRVRSRRPGKWWGANIRPGLTTKLWLWLEHDENSAPADLAAADTTTKEDTMSTTKTKARTATPRKTSRKGLSALAAAEKVLADSGKPMSAGAIADAILERKLAPGLKGETPKATIASKLYVAAKAGRLKHGKRGFTLPKAG